MKHLSIKTEFTLIFVVFTAALIMSLYLFNRFLLEPYYERDKVRVFTLAYSTLDKVALLSEDSGSDLIDYVESGFDQMGEDSPAISILRTLNEGSNIDIAFMSSDMQRVVSTSREANWIAQKLISYVNLLYGNSFFISDSYSQNHTYYIDPASLSFNDLDDGLISSAALIGGQSYELIKSSERYIIHIIGDNRSGEQYIECFGMFSDNKTFFLMSSPLSNISEGVRIATRFMFLTGTLILILGSIIVYFVVRRLTDPILRLSRLSDRMARLDFSERYEGQSANEIGVLGNSMNTMSDMLEAYIGELKEANRLLQEDLKDKIKVDEARKEFIANVSHELKTPIALIEGYAEGLSEGIAEDKEGRDYYCHVIMDETIKMTRLVSELTSLISYEFGNEGLDKSVFDLAGLIKSLCDALSVKYADKDAHITLNLPDELMVNADEFKIEEALTNYLTNAYNHLGGDNNIIIGLSRDKDEVAVTVYNDGENIPEESLPHLWEKFYKVDKARTRAYGGSGIGLSIVRAIIEAHGGRYGVANKTGGVEFYFTLPAHID